MPRPSHQNRALHTSDHDSHPDSDSDSDSTTSSVIPLEKQAVFGAGLKRKRITFIPAGIPRGDAETQTSSASNSDVTPAQRYWTIVSGQQTQKTAPVEGKASGPSAIPASGLDPPGQLEGEKQHQDSRQDSSDSATEWTTDDEHEHEHDTDETGKKDDICPVCHLPMHLTTYSPASTTMDGGHSIGLVPHTHTHESLLAHQVSLPHIHPPSALDRRRMGVRYLTAWGWDVDSRTGLGKSGTGRRDIVRVVNKQDTLGLGVEIEKGGKGVVAKKKPTLNARQARAWAAKGRKRTNELHARMFGREDEIEKILKGA